MDNVGYLNNRTDEEIRMLRDILDDILLEIKNGSDAGVLIESKNQGVACIVDLELFNKLMKSYKKED